MSASAGKPETAVRDRSLDAFRALFILAVLVFHYLARWAPPRNAVNLYGYDHLYSRWLELGKFGVHVFFMISGLFITVTLLRSANVIEFVYKRVYRIYPAFVVAALFTFVVVRLFGPEQLRVGWSGLALTLTLLGTDVSAKVVDGAYWSLAVEAKFYFWVAVAYWALRERFWMGLIGLAMLGVAVDLVSPPVATRILIAPYMPLFLVGMALAYHLFRREPRVAAILYPAAALTYLCHWTFYSLHTGETLQPNLVIIASVGLVLACSYLRARLDHPMLVYLGLISYEIYLIHQNVGVTVIAQMKSRLGVPDAVAFLTAIGVAIGLAALLHHVAQRPVQALFRAVWERLYHRRAPAAVAE